MSERAGWPLSEIAAQQINRLRKQAGLNREQIAERCREVGAPTTLTAAAVANIETGRPDETGRRRRDVTAEEIVFFARALGVPPLVLLFPVGTVDEVEVLPGTFVPTWPAAQWFTGERPLPTGRLADGSPYVSEDDMLAWARGANQLGLVRSHAQVVDQWGRAKRAADAQRDLATTAPADQQDTHRQNVDHFEWLARDLERFLADDRRTMRQVGLTPPELPDELRHIDKEERP
jgi:transcriptional regulator with XRE-family HTH domain